MLRLLDDLPSFGFASSPASHTAFAPPRPIVNYAVNWAFFSVAHIRFLQIRARSSCILCFSDHLPSSLLASSTASHTAFAPRLPIANFAVNWTLICIADHCYLKIRTVPSMLCLFKDLPFYRLAFTHCSP